MVFLSLIFVNGSFCSRLDAGSALIRQLRRQEVLELAEALDVELDEDRVVGKKLNGREC